MLLLIYENIGFIGLWPMSNVCSSTYIPFILHMLGSTHEHAYVLWVMGHCHIVGPVYSKHTLAKYVEDDPCEEFLEIL